MSDAFHTPADANTLVQRLQSAEKSIQFIQREHASTLANLHEEIAKWQQNVAVRIKSTKTLISSYSYLELTFQLAIGGGTIINSSDDTKLRSTIEQLKDELEQCNETVKNLNKILQEKEKSINDYENRLLVNERKHALDLRLENDKQRQLKIELEQRSTLVAQLTNQLHREKQLQQQLQTRARLGQVILPNKPTKIQCVDESAQQRLPTKQLHNRSSSLNHRASPDRDLTLLVVKRRPPTPPQQLRPLSSKSIDSTDEQIYTKRQRQLLDNHTETIEANKITATRVPLKRSTILPPIANKSMPLKALATTVFHQKSEA